MASTRLRSASTVPVALPPRALHLFDAETGEALRHGLEPRESCRRHERDLIIGVDAGTSVIKAVAFDLDGGEIALPSGGRTTTSTLPGGGVEQDMARTWDDAAAALRALAETLAGPAAPGTALAVTGQGDGTWLIDARRRAGGAGLAVARLARRRHRRELEADGVAPRDLSPSPAPASMPASSRPSWSGSSGTRRRCSPRGDRLPLQGLALFQASPASA